VSGTRTTTRPRGLRPRSLPAFLSALLTLTALACGGDNLTLPGDGDPARIEIAGGDDQTGTVGQPLDDSLVVKVTDSGRRPVEGVEVVFVPPAGAGLAPNDTILTDSKGEAAVHYTLSTTAGEQTIEARATAIVPATASSAVFTAAADPESAEQLVMADGDDQMAEVATALPESLAVTAVDRFGNGVAGIEVTWAAKGGGEVSPGSVVTGADGRAATQRTLGDHPGSYGSTAEAEDLEGSPISFDARAIAAPQPALALVTEPSTSAAAGVRLERQPELQLQDPFGAPLSRENVRVTVQIADGGGSVGGTTAARSDANGRVSFTNLELRGRTGSRTLIFAAEGFTPVTSGTITVRPGPPASSRSSVSVPDGTAGIATTVTVHLEDEFDNPVTGAGDLLSVSVQGVNPTPGLSVTELGDGTYSSSYLPVHSGTDVVMVEFNNQPLAGGSFQSTVAPGPADPAHTTAEVTRTPGIFTQITAVVTTRDAQDNLLGHGGDRVQIEINGAAQGDAVDRGDGTYVYSNVYLGVQFSVVITLNGAPIQGGPFTPEVR
jgi:Big-like domain-containing protein/filamin/ABP280 repeat protein